MTLEQIRDLLELGRRRFLMASTADVVAAVEVQTFQCDLRWPALYWQAIAIAEATVDLAIARWCLQLSRELGAPLHHVHKRRPAPAPPSFFDRLASRPLQQRRAVETASQHALRLLERRSRDVVEDHLDGLSGPLKLWVDRP